LIERLPNAMTKDFGSEIMAAAAERAEKSGINTENVGKAAVAAKKMGFKPPGLRSVMVFLRARFPAFIGVNV